MAIMINSLSRILVQGFTGDKATFHAQKMIEYGSKVVGGPKDGQIAVLLKGRPNTAMAFFARLTDTELAAVITYTRTSWGNKSGEVQPSDVKAARAKG